MSAPKMILGVALVGLIATVSLVPTMGRVFLPEFQEKSLVNSMVLFPGVSLDMTTGAGTALQNTLAGNPLFEWVQIRAGRTPGDADGAGVNIAHVDVELSDEAMKDREASVQALRESFNKLPGVAPNVGGFISHRMDEVLSGVRSAIAIKIFGPDLDQLLALGEQVRDTIEPDFRRCRFAARATSPRPTGSHSILDRPAAAGYGLTMTQLSG